MAQWQRLAIAPSQRQAQQITLTSQQRHYLQRVLRLHAGERFIVIEGQGQAWLAELAGETAQVIEPMIVQTELPVSLMLMVALPKGNGFEEIIRPVIEVGVTTIQPLLSDRTLLQPSPHKLERWQRIAQEAAEQSERQIIPRLLAPIPFLTSLQTEPASHEAHRYICVTRQPAPHLLACLPALSQLSITKTADNPLLSIVIATGPEGGWTDAELEVAIAAGFQPVSLGPRILRAVTAPVVAAAIVAAVFER